jgi:hypothetical protein
MAVTDTPTLRLVLALAAETCVHSPYDGVDRKRARARVTCVTMVNIPSTVAVRSRRSCHGPAVQRLAARRRLRHRDEPGGITHVRGSDAIEPFRRPSDGSRYRRDVRKPKYHRNFPIRNSLIDTTPRKNCAKKVAPSSKMHYARKRIGICLHSSNLD